MLCWWWPAYFYELYLLAWDAAGGLGACLVCALWLSGQHAMEPEVCNCRGCFGASHCTQTNSVAACR